MQRTEDNVFQSPEADELYILLRAVIDPARYSLVRAALATELLGYDAAQIDALEQSDNQWQDLLDQFASYPETWRRQGFSRMFRRITQDFSVEHRLLSRADGQRRVTNLLHAADLLQRESSRRRGGLEEVLIWMQEQRQVDRPDDQTMLLRLESDEDLVNIMTVHFSKGLQFPVVFCPYLWTTFSLRPGDLLEFHNEDNRACLDLSVDPDPEHKMQVNVERLAERIRLAYVALTRAELACWAVWGTKRSHIQSSFSWLLLPPENIADTPLTTAVQEMQMRKSSEIAQRLQSLQTDSLKAGPMPTATSRRLAIRADAATRLQSRVLKHDVPRGWRVSSFSAMTRHVVEEPRDYDAGKSSEQPVETEPQGIFAFPRGARAGRCMHELLENIAFDADSMTIEAVAVKTLSAYGFDPADAAVLAAMAHNVLNTSLSRDAVLRLCDVKPAGRVVEMEFYFPITALDAGHLRTTLGEFGAGTPIEKRLAQLEFRVGDGFMHGFIDLVFEADNRYYLVDYKSNWLGGVSADYHLERLHTEIAKHDYYLQYLIYSLALHRYLEKRLPEYDYELHFGGAYYLFLRGMHPDHGPDYGVFHDRPDYKLIQRLDQLFGRSTKQ